MNGTNDFVLFSFAFLKRSNLILVIRRDDVWVTNGLIQGATSSYFLDRDSLLNFPNEFRQINLKSVTLPIQYLKVKSAVNLQIKILRKKKCRVSSFGSNSVKQEKRKFWEKPLWFVSLNYFYDETSYDISAVSSARPYPVHSPWVRELG